MKKKIFIAAAVIFSSHVHAQKDTAVKTLDEVIVTANKFPQKQSTTGKVITVITKDQIEKSNGRSISQLLNEQAGVSVSGALNNLGSNQTVYLRGASAGRTLILMDGIPVYDPSFNNADFDLNLISLNNIESIEICRGAQSTLYGSDAVAGVINIITIKKDITKPLNVKATASAGNYGTFRGNIQLYGNAAGKLTYTARYEKLSAKGFSSAYDSTGNKNYDNDQYDGEIGSASLQYQATPDISVRAFVQHSHYKTDLDAAAFTDEKDYTVNNKSIITGFGAHYQKNNIAITGNYQYSENKRNYFNDSIDQPTLIFSTDDYVGKTQFAEIFTSLGIGKNFTFLQGADYRRSSFRSQ